MADKGIIFSAPMVRALLDGGKTQTRRLLNPQPVHAVDSVRQVAVRKDSNRPVFMMHSRAGQPIYGLPTAVGLAGELVPGYAIGDRLYVRECWHVRGIFSDVVEVGYRASELRGHTEYVEQFPVDTAVKCKPKQGRPEPKWPEYPKYGPSILMPRWASRLWLSVKDVRVQRLQDCSESDAMAEGWPGEQGQLWPLDWYRDLWNSLHIGEGQCWQDNPWVVAVSFEVHRGNIGKASDIRPSEVPY